MSHNPTPEQQAIIDFIATKPTRSLMVDARAGAAKTTTIELASKFVDIKFSALSLAFNKRIAEELKTRLPSHFDCLTLNSLGHRAWSSTLGKRLELDADKMFKLTKSIVPQELSEGDDAIFTDVLNLSRKAKGAGLVPAGAPFGIKGLYPDTKDSWETIGSDIFDLTDDAIYFARQVVLQSIKDAYQGRIDFDDQIYMSVLFGGKFPKYHTVFVDEAQDLSPLNHLQLVRCVGVRLVAVGDPYQAIYAFRGADSNSMTNLMEHFQFDRLGLTQSFRVPKSISARQLDHVPDFGSMPFLQDGTVEDWPIYEHNGDQHPSWSIASLPRSGFILCRNNAPLMKLAFAIIKTKRPVKILGRDIGANLANLLDKIVSKNGATPVGDAYDLVGAWATEEVAKAGDKESKVATILDRKECLEVLLEAAECKTAGEAMNFIRALFSDQRDEDQLTLSSGHKAKGLEAHWVMHLDPHRIPSMQAQKALLRGDSGPMMQELNLKYVIETRSKAVLINAELNECVEIED